ncbi:unnamed protein product [Rodentolepis nana]|uniref:Centrosome and spindle pole-associated protein 1 n=1 Tax=Rodentolepis nana TaxID=102285 RepID=A0A0R3T232_RODNA|nr:unnamed protein product [Rodentolepis nana]
MENLQKRRELNMEYQKFKVMDEERFRNRFANKKVNKVIPTAPDPIKEIEAHNKNGNPNRNMEVLLKRLDVLQQNVEDLRKSQPKANYIQDNIVPFSSNIYQPNIIDEALKRIDELEDAIKAMSVSENVKKTRGNSEYLTIDNDFSTVPKSVSVVNEEPDSLERSQRMAKQRYANDLKLQIEEKQRQKELQRQREREEDLLKMAETLEYDTLGHRIRDKTTGTSFSKKNIISHGKQENFARGGNGIFGDPLTESQKIANLNYRNELSLQIEEKRLREEMRKQVEKELELKELQSYIDEEKPSSYPKPSESPQTRRSSESIQVSLPPNDTRRQSVCVQVNLELQPGRPKAMKVVRSVPIMEKPRKAPKVDELMAQITQLKVELDAEKLRMERNRTETLDEVHVYDPRSIIRNKLPSRDLKRPMKVHRLLAVPNNSIIKQRPDHNVVLSSSSQFLPQLSHYVLSQSPSLGSLNLDEINKQMKRRLENLKINESLDDLYKNEPPIIRDFMAEEEAKLLENSAYFVS